MLRPFQDIERWADRTAVVRADGASWTYAELVEQADQWAEQLGDRRGLVAIEMANTWVSLVAWIGASRAGFPVLLLDRRALERDARICAKFSPDFEYTETVTGWQLRENPRRAGEEMHADLALLLTTSGSAGEPKLVRLSAKNVVSGATAIALYLGITAADRAVTALPLHYSYGISVVTSHLMAGASLALTDTGVHEAGFWAEFEVMAATSFAGVPLTYELLEEQGFLKRSVRGLRTMTQAGGKLAPERVRRFASELSRSGAEFWVMYGQTEASPRISYLPPEMAEFVPQSIGYAVPGGVIRLVDAAGEVVTEPGESGELCFAGPNVMMGYAVDRSDLAKRAEVSELKTGDIAKRDWAGRYEIVGRSSRWVKVVGLRISLDGIESDLEDDGRRARVAGTTDRIVIAVTDDTESAELKDEWVERLGIPRSSLRVIAVDAVPQLANGKIDYRAILRAGATDQKTEEGGREGVGLREELGGVLNVTHLEDDESFRSAGGDSLNYLEGALAVERFYGRRVPGWESLPMAQLCLGEAEVRPRAGGEDPLVVTRTIAIGLTILSHIIFKLEAWWEMQAAFFTTALATPLLLVVFGAAVERSVGGREIGRSVRGLIGRYWPMAMTFYGAILVTLFFQFITGDETWERTKEALIFNGFGKYAGIWMTYCAMVIIVPFLIAAVERWGVWMALLIIEATWLVWPWLADMPEGDYFWAFLFGFSEITGPSVLHSTTFVLFGYLWSRARRGWGAVVLAGAMILLAEVVVWWNVAEYGWGEVWPRFAFQYYRQLNHPVYFALGLLGAVLMLVLGRWWGRKQRWGGRGGVIFSLGRNPLFAYVLTNIILTLTPIGAMTGTQSVAWAVGLFGFVILMTDDVSRWQPRFFGPLARVLRWFNLRLVGLQTLGEGGPIGRWLQSRWG